MTDFTVTLHTLVTVSGTGNLQQARTGRLLQLRIFDYSAVAYTATEISPGIYKFTNVVDDTYRLFIDGGWASDYGTFQINDEFPVVRSNIAMGSFKLTGLAAGAAAGESVRYEQVIRTDGDQTIVAGATKTFNELPRLINPTTGDPYLPTDNSEPTCKLYVDELFGGSTGVVQSPYLVKCIPLRTINDQYSRTTIEGCRTYLAGLSNITTYRGIIFLEPSGNTADNTFNLTTGLWNSNGIDIFGVGRPQLVLSSSNSSMTSDTEISNCVIKDDVSSNGALNRTWINFTFKDCDFLLNNMLVQMTTCNFMGINRFKLTTGATLTLTNCKGTEVIHNDDITPTVTGTQPARITGTNINNLGL